jgi:DNA-binding transcriptional regulator LsrR (DeoR family)
VIPFGRDEHLMTRAAWLYFVSGLTQDDIGKSLGLTRLRVNRLLAQARDLGIVQIRINSRLAECVALEEALKARFGLTEAVVVPSPPDESTLPQVIGAAAGAVLDARIEDGMSIGVGWGRTLRISLQSVPRRQLSGLSIVSLLGGLTRGSAINTYETASHMADLFGAQCYYVAGPAMADSARSRDLLMQQPILREAFQRARSIDIAFLSVGSVAPDATMAKVGLIDARELKSLVGAGAVGDLCAYWIDERGVIVDHPLNRRIIAISPADLKAVPCVILASGGRSKIGVLHGALQGGLTDVLVTDEIAAQGVLELADRLDR